MPVAILELVVVFFLMAILLIFQKDIKITQFFLNTPSFLITFGGTFVASIIQFSSKEILGSFKFMKTLFFKDQIYPQQIMNMIIELNNMYKEKGREGLAVIKREITHPILRSGIDLLSSDIERDEFANMLKVSIKSSYSEMKKYERVFNDMGVYAPMFGLIGTLVGLIQLLKELSDPHTIAPNMAVALVTTLYGILLTGLVFLPVSGKIRTKSDIEIINSQIIFDGFMMIKDRVGPLAIEQKLRAYL